ncbi:MAG: hypothetical protein K9G01_06155 [Candidatus Planktophila sp.]|nr:hypothetical protein [Candidatus Planktophila sp.]
MSKFRTHIAVILAMILAVSPLAVYSAVAATGGPKDAVITLQSPFLDASNTSEAKSNQQMADGWVAKGWFGTGLVFQVSFAPVGSTINLTYNVKDKNGKPLAFTRVNLRINKGYSEAASIVEVDGVRTKGIDRPPFDQANVIRLTDAFGNITFALKNLDLESSAEAEPDSYTSKPIFSDDKLDRLHSQMLPEVSSEPADHSVITEFHYFKPKAPIVVPATKPTITLISPKLDATNSVTDAGKNLKQAYAPLGGDLVVVYKVTGDDGRAVPSKVVDLKVNGGKSTLKATTDAFGYAAFTVKNADTKPNNAPASATSAMPAASSAFATLVPEIAGTTAAVAEGVEFHYYRGISTSVAKSGKDFVVSVAIAGAAGKTASVAVTGAKKASVKLSSAMQVVPVKVKAGAKTVTVVIDGKSYTSKVVAK